MGAPDSLPISVLNPSDGVEDISDKLPELRITGVENDFGATSLDAVFKLNGPCYGGCEFGDWQWNTHVVWGGKIFKLSGSVCRRFLNDVMVYNR